MQFLTENMLRPVFKRLNIAKINVRVHGRFYPIVG